MRKPASALPAMDIVDAKDAGNEQRIEQAPLEQFGELDPVFKSVIAESPVFEADLLLHKHLLA